MKERKTITFKRQRKTIIVIMLLFLAFPYVAGAQPIIFQLPNKVEKKANRWIQALTEETSRQAYFRLGVAFNPLFDYELYCCTGLNNDTVWSRFARNSNCFLSIDNHLYPLYFDIDEYYGLDAAQVLDPPGSVGFREGLVKRQVSTFHGFRIEFKQNDTLHNSHKRGLWFRLSKRRKIVKEISPTIDNHFQSKSLPIVYFISDIVETSIEYSLKNREAQNAYIILSHSNGIKLLELVYFDNKDSLEFNEEIITRTNRYLLVGNDKIPIILSYVFVFGASEADNSVFNRQKENNKPYLVLRL